MIVLAIDSCLGAVSVAVAPGDGSGTIVEEYEERETGHAERLAPMLDAVVRRTGLDYSAIDRFAVTIGPGSFTGVRTGVAAARALALATGKPVAGATSLAVIAAAVCGSEPVVPTTSLAVAIDARRGEVYGQVFDPVNGDWSIADCFLATPEAFAARLPETGCRLVGSGAAAVAEEARTIGKRVEVGDTALQPRASTLAGLAHRLPLLQTVSPLYIRAPDAKPQSASILPRA